MNKKVKDRYLEMLNEHYEVCKDSNKFRGRILNYVDEFALLSDKYEKRVKELEVLKSEEKIRLGLEQLEKDVVEKMKEHILITTRFADLTDAAKILFVKELPELIPEFDKIRDRDLYEKMNETHLMKLLDGLEKKLLMKQDEYWKLKKDFEDVFEEFEEGKKGFESYLN